jgi:hypothetical protein
MAIQSTDLFLIERNNIAYRAPISDIPAPAEVGIIANFASPNAGGYISGQFYDNAFHANASQNLAGAANRVEMAPFFVSQSVTIDRLGIAVQPTAIASSLLKCFIYDSNSQGWPDQLLYEGASDLSGAAVAYVAHTLDFSFNAGIQYWLGVRYSSNTTIRGVSASSCCNLGLSAAAGTTYNTKILRAITFANALPQSWAFQASDLETGVCPSIRFRAA